MSALNNVFLQTQYFFINHALSCVFYCLLHLKMSMVETTFCLFVYTLFTYHGREAFTLGQRISISSKININFSTVYRFNDDFCSSKINMLFMHDNPLLEK